MKTMKKMQKVMCIPLQASLDSESNFQLISLAIPPEGETQRHIPDSMRMMSDKNVVKDMNALVFNFFL